MAASTIDVWADFEIIEPTKNQEPVVAQPIETPHSLPSPVIHSTVTESPEPSANFQDFQENLTKEQLSEILKTKNAAALMDAVLDGRVIVLSCDVAHKYRAAYSDLQTVFLPTLQGIAFAFEPLTEKGEEVSSLIVQWQRLAPLVQRLQKANQMQLLMSAPTLITEYNSLAPTLKELWSAFDAAAIRRIDWSAYKAVFERYDIDLSGFKLMSEMLKMKNTKSLKDPDDTTDDNDLHLNSDFI